MIKIIILICILCSTISQRHSRSEPGEHAMDLPVSVDLQKDIKGNSYYDPKDITSSLNNVFKHKNLDLRVLKTVAVDGKFQIEGPTRTTSRTYVYKFAVLNEEKLKTIHSDLYHTNIEDCSSIRLLPVHDQPFITELKTSFDPVKAEECLSLFEGYNNFYPLAPQEARKHRWKNTDGSYNIKDYYFGPQDFDKEIKSISLSKLQPRNMGPIPVYDLFDFYQINITGPSFFRFQIRRMVALMIAVASNKMDLEFVSEMLDDPSTKWPSWLEMPEANGLYLAEVKYPKTFFKGATDEVSKLPLAKTWKNQFFKQINWSEMDKKNVIEPVVIMNIK